MSRVINKPYLIIWLSIPLIMLSGFISSIDKLDVNIHDTYYVFSLFDLNTLISVLFGIIGLGYWIMLKVNGKLSKWLNLIHITLTIGGILIIWVLAQLFRQSKMEYDFNNNLTLAIYSIAFIIIFGQIFYLINIIGGIISRTNKTIG
jgi:heme/copper-type cytochrome/quinol oxidase subunit 1